jgi:hypothetical protein
MSMTLINLGLGGCLYSSSDVELFELVLLGLDSASFCLFLIISLKIVVFLPAIGCLPVSNRSTLCLSISFDNDQLRTILIPTTASIESSFADGTRMVFRISLST